MKNTMLRRQSEKMENALAWWEERNTDMYAYSYALQEASEIMNRMLYHIRELQIKVNSQAEHIKMQDAKLEEIRERERRERRAETSAE